jgi:hypothetical protein
LFTEAQGDVLVQVIVELRKEWREERDEAIAPLKAEISELKARLDVAELKGKLEAVLALLGQKEFKSAEVVNLPNWRRKDVA